MATLGRRKSRLERVLVFMAGLVVVAIALHAASAGGQGPLERGIASLAELPLRAGAGVHRLASNLWLASFEADRLREENEELRAQLLANRISQSIDLAEAATAELAERVAATLPMGPVDLITAPVLAAPSAGHRQVLWVGMGTNEGVHPGMAVLGPHGLIGLVERTTSGMAMIRLVTDRLSSWGAEVSGLGELGLLKGTGDPTIVELHFSRTATEATGGLPVTTSGMAGSVAPAGIPFGTVIEVVASKKDEPMARVELPSDPSRLRTVWILPQRPIELEGRAP
jgi:rod shape-determining protein MreC